MKDRARMGFLEMAVIAFCVWQSFDLLHAWRHAPFDRWDGLAFLIWLTPLGLTLRAGGELRGHVPMLALALFFSFAGGIVELNALRDFGLALALVSLRPAPWRATPWLMAAVAWMPVLGWCASHASVAAVLPLRLLIALAGALTACVTNTGDRLKT